MTLRKHVYSNILKISPPRTESFQIKIWSYFHSAAQNVDCGYPLEPPRQGGSNEYPQSMFLSRNMKNNVYPCKPQFYYIKVGFKGSKVYRPVFVMNWGYMWPMHAQVRMRACPDQTDQTAHVRMHSCLRKTLFTSALKTDFVMEGIYVLF